jgi:hypothetical protein
MYLLRLLNWFGRWYSSHELAIIEVTFGLDPFAALHSETRYNNMPLLQLLN